MMMETINEKLLSLVEGRETPESYQNWWLKHEHELERVLNRGEFLRLKPKDHDFLWVPILTSQKGAIAILERKGLPFSKSNLYQEKYLEELDVYCKDKKKREQEKKKKVKEEHPNLFEHYPKFTNALVKSLDENDVIKQGATQEEIRKAEEKLSFAFPEQVQRFFLITSGIDLSTGIKVVLNEMFSMEIKEKQYLVLGEFWKEADGDQLLLCHDEETIWYYAHEQNKVKKLCNDMNEFLEKKLSRYLSR